ncbi:MAG: hypothetical protein J6K62_06850 [Clostridia bacterium]|nr:hypothetical protein [Clostridia bacterium]
MRKMQCEVCGSTEIKKTTDDTFECQSCGVQYSKDEIQKLFVEITGTVKIDHSDEVDNAIKRAEQFVQSDDKQKAEEYLNKALDMDAENEKALKLLEEIADGKKLDAFTLVEATVDPNTTVERFLRELVQVDDIACDIYNEVDVVSVKQYYRPAFYSKNRCLCTWTAVACHVYYENETVWEEKYDPNKRKYVKEPVTKKVKRVNRVPENGSFYFDCNGFGFVSDAICKGITGVEASSKSELVECFEELQADKYWEYQLKKLDMSQVTKQDGKLYYNGLEIDFEIDSAVYQNKRKRIVDSSDQEALNRAESEVGGDYCENLNAKRTVVEHSVQYILIPVQVIEYTYKGVHYAAVLDLVSESLTMPKLYPRDTSLDQTKAELSADRAYAQKMPGTLVGGLILGVVWGLLLVFAAITDMQDDGFITVLMGMAIVSLILMIVGLVQRNARRTRVEQKAVEYKKAIYRPRRMALFAMYEQFFASFDKHGNIAVARKSLPAADLVVSEFKMGLAVAEEAQPRDANLTNLLNGQDARAEQLEAEIAKLKKIRIVAYVLMALLMFGVPFIVGVILYGNTNGKILAKKAELEKINQGWFGA